MDKVNADARGVVRWICQCGYQCSARSSFAALQCLTDHASICEFVYVPPTNQEKKNDGN